MTDFLSNSTDALCPEVTSVRRHHSPGSTDTYLCVYRFDCACEVLTNIVNQLESFTDRPHMFYLNIVLSKGFCEGYLKAQGLS